ncbi:MAG: hypothetical protein WD875_07990 [Pirellulales bacterium]
MALGNVAFARCESLIQYGVDVVERRFLGAVGEHPRLERYATMLGELNRFLRTENAIFVDCVNGFHLRLPRKGSSVAAIVAADVVLCILPSTRAAEYGWRATRLGRREGENRDFDSQYGSEVGRIGRVKTVLLCESTFGEIHR